MVDGHDRLVADVGGAQAGSDEERWAAAMSVLERSPDGTAQQRLRRQKMVVWSAVAGVTLVGLGVGALVAVLVLGADDGPDADPPPWREVSGPALQAVGLVAMAVGAVSGWRAGVWRGIWSQPAAVLSRAQRRSLLAQVRGKAAVESARLPLARAVAQRMLLQRHLLLFWAGLLLQQVGRAVGSTGRLQLVFALVGVAGYAIVVPALARMAGQGERFLRAHPAGFDAT